jgi:hypothetical protein
MKEARKGGRSLPIHTGAAVTSGRNGVWGVRV